MKKCLVLLLFLLALPSFAVTETWLQPELEESYKKGDFSSVVSIAGKILSYKENAEVYFMKADAETGLDNFEQALFDVSKSLELNKTKKAYGLRMYLNAKTNKEEVLIYTDMAESLKNCGEYDRKYILKILNDDNISQKYKLILYSDLIKLQQEPSFVYRYAKFVSRTNALSEEERTKKLSAIKEYITSESFGLKSSFEDIYDTYKDIYFALYEFAIGQNEEESLNILWGSLKLIEKERYTEWTSYRTNDKRLSDLRQPIRELVNVCLNAIFEEDCNTSNSEEIDWDSYALSAIKTIRKMVRRYSYNITNREITVEFKILKNGKVFLEFPEEELNFFRGPKIVHQNGRDYRISSGYGESNLLIYIKETTFPPLPVEYNGKYVKMRFKFNENK